MDTLTRHHLFPTSCLLFFCCFSVIFLDMLSPIVRALFIISVAIYIVDDRRFSRLIIMNQIGWQRTERVANKMHLDTRKCIKTIYRRATSATKRG